MSEEKKLVVEEKPKTAITEIKEEVEKKLNTPTKMDIEPTLDQVKKQQNDLTKNSNSNEEEKT